MPTYEYIREDGTTFEVFQSIKDEPLEQCPDTGQKVKRIISGGGGVVYKGDGFYITDYKNKVNGKSAGKNGSESSSKADNTAKTSEAKTGSEKSDNT